MILAREKVAWLTNGVDISVSIVMHVYGCTMELIYCNLSAHDSDFTSLNYRL